MAYAKNNHYMITPYDKDIIGLLFDAGYNRIRISKGTPKGYFCSIRKDRELIQLNGSTWIELQDKLYDMLYDIMYGTHKK